MYCPHCLTEYREGFERCSDCNVLLSPGPPPQSRRLEPPNEATLVTVLETMDTMALMLAQAALDEAGIAYAVRAQDSAVQEFQGLYRASAPTVWKCQSRIEVAPEDAGRARELLEPLQNPEPLPEDVDPDQ